MGDNLMHTCSICNEKFDGWMMYTMHKEMSHTQVPVEMPGIKRPLTRAAKALLVERGETRIGKRHFIGHGV